MKRPAIIAGIGLMIIVAAKLGFAPLFRMILEQRREETPVHVAMRDEARGPNGERLAPVWLRAEPGREIASELTIRVTLEGAFLEDTKLDLAYAHVVADMFLKSQQKSGIPLEFEDYALYFQAIELIDKLRLSSADCIWINTRDPNQTPSTTRGSVRR